MGFGRVTKYWHVNLNDIRNNPSGTPEGAIQAWDEAVREASCKYDGENHQLCCNNCHDHVSNALNRLAFKGKTNWGTASLTWYLIFNGKFGRYVGE